jgi:hypothetical protein
MTKQLPPAVAIAGILVAFAVVGTIDYEVAMAQHEREGVALAVSCVRTDSPSTDEREDKPRSSVTVADAQAHRAHALDELRMLCRVTAARAGADARNPVASLPSLGALTALRVADEAEVVVRDAR